MFKLELLDDDTYKVIEYYENLDAQQLHSKLWHVALEEIMARVWKRDDKNNWKPATPEDLKAICR